MLRNEFSNTKTAEADEYMCRMLATDRSRRCLRSLSTGMQTVSIQKGTLPDGFSGIETWLTLFCKSARRHAGSELV